MANDETGNIPSENSPDATLGSQDAGLSEAEKQQELAKRRKERFKPSPGIADRIAGEADQFVSELKPYLPQELIGGVVPYVPGTEEEAVWNAASQACATEKVHFCYKIDEGKVWYLACPSHTLSSNPDSWCPLAAALPGNSEFWDKETVYLYEQEGVASALRWDSDTGRMQVFLGAARTILPRVQSMDANFATINPEVADIVPWKNRSLNTEKLSRATARSLLFSGMFVVLTAIAILLYSYIQIGTIQRDLSSVRKKTESASNDLMLKAFSAMQNDTIKHMVRIQELLSTLSQVDGTLVKYEVSRGRLTWEALVPNNFASDFGRSVGKAEDGRARVQGTK